jgi:hypothetical protein
MAFGQTTKEAHGRVGMGVDEAGHEEALAEVDVVVYGLWWRSGAEGLDTAVFHHHIPRLQNRVLIIETDDLGGLKE